MSSTAPRRKEGVQARKLENEWILYDPQRGDLHVINDVAHFVWGLCDGHHSLDDLCREVDQSYDVPEEADLRKDLQAILDSLTQRGVLG
jgi:hypothetical protein